MMTAVRLVFYLLVAASVGGTACNVRGEPPAPQYITILTGWTGGAFYPLGAALADIYNRGIPGMKATAVEHRQRFRELMGDPWSYAIYHCGTAANIYSPVHWSYFPGFALPRHLNPANTEWRRGR